MRFIQEAILVIGLTLFGMWLVLKINDSKQKVMGQTDDGV